MTDLYDNPEIAARDMGMALAADSNTELLEWLRIRMVRLWKINRIMEPEAFVSADDARKILEEAIEEGKIERPACMNFLGSLFKAPGWKPTGKYIKSRTRGSHANRLVAWKWIGE